MWEEEMQRLGMLVPKMNTLGSNMYEWVKLLEADLDKLGVGLQVSVQGETDLILSYMRCHSRFQLVVTYQDLVAGKVVPVTRPWNEAKRDLKIQSFDMIGGLLEELIRQVEIRITKLSTLEEE